MEVTYQQASAAAAAARAVAEVTEWTKKNERNYQIRKFFSRNKRRQRVAKNDRAARKLGYVSNKVVMALPFNTVTETSQDARSLAQRSLTEPEVKQDKERDDQLRNELQILPTIFWSMGKSFHDGKTDSYFILKEKEWLDEHESRERTPQWQSSKGLIAWSLPLPFVLKTQSGRWQMDKFLALAFFLGCPLIDRTGTLNDQLGLKLVNLHPIPRRNPHFNKNLATIMLERAREALSCCLERRNKEIHVLWSGGIDTTSVVCAFLQVTESGDARRNLIVVRYTERSIEEYPAFFHDIIVPQLRTRIIEGHVRDAFTVVNDDSPEENIPLVVTGDPADMLFGTFRMAGALVHGAYSLDEPWQTRFPLLLHERRLLLNGIDYLDSKTKQPKYVPNRKVRLASRAWVKWIRPQVAKSPIPIRTMFDFWWWITYSCKYNHDVHRVFYNRETVSFKLRSRVFNFYQSEDFHQYSFAAHEDKMKDKHVWASYKHPLKEFIFSRCKYRDDVPGWSRPGDHITYYLSKIKVPSVANSFGMEVGLDSNWKVVKFGAASLSLRALSLEHGSRLDDTFLTDGGKRKKEGDLYWVEGNFETAEKFYAVAKSNGIDCSEDIRSCRNAQRRLANHKSPIFKHDQGALERRKLHGVIAHKSWDDNRYASVYRDAVGGE